MGFVIAAILVLLLASGIVLFIVMRATKTDGSPAGDTTEHAGEQDDGHTVSGQDAERDSQDRGAGSEHRPSDAPRVGDPDARLTGPRDGH